MNAIIFTFKNILTLENKKTKDTTNTIIKKKRRLNRGKQVQSV